MTIQDPRDLVWSLYFDGAMNMKGRGIGAVLLSPKGVAIPQVCQLTFLTTNNVAEYEALLAGLKHAHILGVVRLKVMGDSQVILRQVLKKYRIHDPKLIPYQKLVDKMMKKFRRIIFVHVPRSQNILADSLASLSSSYSFPLRQEQETIILQRLHIPVIKDPWFIKTTKKVKEPSEDANTGTLMIVSLLESDEEPEEELP